MCFCYVFVNCKPHRNILSFYFEQQQVYVGGMESPLENSTKYPSINFNPSSIQHFKMLSACSTQGPESDAEIQFTQVYSHSRGQP